MKLICYYEPNRKLDIYIDKVLYKTPASFPDTIEVELSDGIHLLDHLLIGLRMLGY